MHSDYEFQQMGPHDWIVRYAGRTLARGSQCEVVCAVLDHAEGKAARPRHRRARRRRR